MTSLFKYKFFVVFIALSLGLSFIVSTSASAKTPYDNDIKNEIPLIGTITKGNKIYNKSYSTPSFLQDLYISSSIEPLVKAFKAESLDYDNGARWAIMSYRNRSDHRVPFYIFGNKDIKMRIGRIFHNNNFLTRWAFCNDGSTRSQLRIYTFETGYTSSSFDGFTYLRSDGGSIAPGECTFIHSKGGDYRSYINNFNIQYPEGYEGDRFYAELPSSDDTSSSKRSIYPRFFAMVTTDNSVFANLDLDYFKNNKLPIPKHSVFFLVKPDGTIVKTPNITNGLSIWDNLEKGDYRLILHSSSGDENYEYKPVYFDIQVGKYNYSYFIHYNESKGRYCLFSNRLKDVSPENLENIKNSGSIWSGFLHTLFGSNSSISPGESYARCDIPQPDQNSKPDDFSSFNPQGLTEYVSNCDLTDIPCHMTKFFNKLLEFIKWLFIPTFPDIKGCFDSFFIDVRESVGGVYGFVESIILSFKTLLSLIYPSLFDAQYFPPCDFIPSFSFFNSPFNVDLCRFENVVGSANFTKIRSFISITFVFVSMFFARNIIFKFFRMLGDS